VRSALRRQSGSHPSLEAVATAPDAEASLKRSMRLRGRRSGQSAGRLAIKTQLYGRYCCGGEERRSGSGERTLTDRFSSGSCMDGVGRCSDGEYDRIRQSRAQNDKLALWPRLCCGVSSPVGAAKAAGEGRHVVQGRRCICAGDGPIDRFVACIRLRRTYG
jgi:hypothetical protein